MSDPQILAALRRIEGLQDLSEPVLQVLVGFAAFRTIRKGETLFCQGEPSPYCYGILTGEVSLSRIHPPRPPALIATLGPGRCLGGMSLLVEGPRPGQASVTADGQVLSLWSSRFRQWTDDQRSLAGDPPFLEPLRHVLAGLSNP